MSNYSLFDAMAIQQAFGRLPKGASKAAGQARQAFASALNAMGITFSIFEVSRKEHAIRVWSASGNNFPEDQVKKWCEFITGPIGTLAENDGKWYLKTGRSNFEVYDRKSDANASAMAMLRTMAAA